MNTSAGQRLVKAPPADAQALARSFAYCRQITRQRAGNFYHGLRLMTEPKRSAMYAVYAWMRTADDLADEPGGLQTKTARLGAFRARTAQALGRPSLSHAAAAETTSGEDHDLMWPAVSDTLVCYAIDAQVLGEMIDGQLLDQYKTRYATFEELRDYCYKVASTVGLVCLSVWGHDGSAEVRSKAVDRGLALQLTNILRDLVEDARRDRVYLPADVLAEYGFDADTFRKFLLEPTVSGEAQARFDALMRQQVDLARSFYVSSSNLEQHISADCRAACWAMMRIYEALLEKIAADPRGVLRGRVSLSTWRKLGIAWTAWRKRGA